MLTLDDGMVLPHPRNAERAPEIVPFRCCWSVSRPAAIRGFMMTDDSGIKKFFKKNWEEMTLWAILIGLFCLLKSFFLLVFATFLITSITKGMVDFVVNRLKLNYRLVTVIVFVLFVGVIGLVGAWVGPKLVVETHQVLVAFTGNDDQQEGQRIDRFVENVTAKIIGDEKMQVFIASDEYIAMSKSLKSEFKKAAGTAFPRVLATVVHFVKLVWEILISFLLAIIFSFMLVMDWRLMAGKMKELETSRIRTFYIGIAPHLVAFARVLSKALRAQAIIAICNTILTAIGLWLLGVPSIALLSAIVFLCGFIPILGTFLSSIPILIFGIQVGGLSLALNLIILIAVIHAFEAYILNPNITANVLRIHPLLVLTFLLIGERFFGIWGMVLGVPIGCYVMSVLTKKEGHSLVDTPHEPSC
jgi:predicted PurR-regulated permease PerM